MLQRAGAWSPLQRTMVLGASVTAATFALLVWRAGLDVLPAAHDDGSFYLRMADVGSGAEILPPFRNRLLTPLIVAVLPLPSSWGFALVTATATGVTAAVMDRMLRLWFPARITWFGLALLAVSPLLVSVDDLYRVDAVMAAFSTSILFCLATHRWGWLLALVPVATLNHELVLVLLIPVLLTARREDRLGEGAAVALLSLAAWGVMHQSGWIVPPNDRANLFDADHREEMVRWNAAKYGTVAGALWEHFVRYIGILGLLAPFGWRTAPPLIRDATWILVPCTLAMLTASDWGRLFIPALPVLVVLSCAAAARLGDDEPTPRGRTTALGDPPTAR